MLQIELCRLSLLLVLSLAPRVFSPGTPDFSPLLKNEHFQVPVRSGTAWKAQTRLSSTPKCSVGKQTKANYEFNRY